MNEYIQIPYWPEDHAKKAYSEDYYIEAIQAIHGFIELQLRELLFLSSPISETHDHFDLAIDTMYEISLSVAVKVLFIQKVLSKEERDSLIQFNKARNQMIHKIYCDRTKGDGKGIPRKEYDMAFECGLRLMGLVSDKIQQAMEK